MNPELEKAGKSYPLGRLGTTEDMANLILFLSSKDSAFLTGQNICADGGSTWGGDSQVWPRPLSHLLLILDSIRGSYIIIFLTSFLIYTGELSNLLKLPVRSNTSWRNRFHHLNSKHKCTDVLPISSRLITHSPVSTDSIKSLQKALSVCLSYRKLLTMNNRLPSVN